MNHKERVSDRVLTSTLISKNDSVSKPGETYIEK